MAAGPGFEKPVQFAFHQLKRLFRAQHQSFHPTPMQVENVGVAEEVTKLQVVVQALITEALKPVYRLSAEADTLLREAAADPHGRVMMARTRSGLFVQTNKRQFTEQMSARSEATWQGAVRELLQKGLLENAGSKGEVFRVTTEGYRAADDLKSGRSSAATEG